MTQSRLPNPTVSQLFKLLADAYSRAQEDIADEIARMAVAPSGEDSDLSRETIMSYVKEPKSVTVGKRQVKRRNSETPVHYKFAHLVMNYLDGRRPEQQAHTDPARPSAQ